MPAATSPDARVAGAAAEGPPAPRPWRASDWARLVPALVVALPALYWVVSATARASLTPLGRDQGIFQYVAWAIRNGDIDYRDVRDVNGPLAPFVHVVFQWLGGADEHRFRVLDLAVSGLSFALVGACLPGLGRGTPPRPLERLAWALAGWVVLGAQYLQFGYWDIAQRESFFDWFLLPSLALGLVARSSAPFARPGRRRTALRFVCGGLSVVPWFGKPTYALFTLVQLAALGFDRAPRETRRSALLAFAAGGAASALTLLACVLTWGDLRAYIHTQLVDVPAMYRFIWSRSPADVLAEPWRGGQVLEALESSAVLGALVVVGELPRRTLAVVLAPLAATAGILVQGKAFPYHFHPLTATVHLQWLVGLAWLGERASEAARRADASGDRLAGPARRSLARLVPIALAGVLSFHLADRLLASPHLRATWLLRGAATAEARRTREYFAHFPESDFFPFELRRTADYVREHTRPDERVQTYGMDPYVLFLAGRLSATPYIYAYDLDADAAIAGGTGARPNDAQQARIRSIRDAHEADLLSRLRARPPAAFVFFDGAPLLSDTSAWDDFADHCPTAAAWVETRYREAARFGHDHVWLRLDRLPDGPAAEDPAPADTDPTQEAP